MEHVPSYQSLPFAAVDTRNWTQPLETASRYGHACTCRFPENTSDISIHLNLASHIYTAYMYIHVPVYMYMYIPVYVYV